MRIVIVGCGRYGALLANGLSPSGHGVVVIDRREGAFKGLCQEFGGFTIVGDAAELSVLEKADIRTTDCLLSVCNEDTLNLMVTQIAKFIFRVPKVIARVYKPSYETAFRRMGIDIISPISLAAEAVFKTLGVDNEGSRQEVQ